MSYVFSTTNDHVYVTDIGYGKLVKCDKFNNINNKQEKEK
jgi:hypothetical protein